MSKHSTRHYCRNTHCRAKLAAPVDNEHHAFCTSGCHATRAQQPATPVIGFLSGASFDTMHEYVAALHRGLADAGFDLGRNLAICRPLQCWAVIGDCPTSIEEVGHMSDTELLPKPKREPEPVRRLEVFTGVGRRRRWTAEQKARIVAESYESSETVCAVARRHGLTPQQLFGWRRHTRRAEDGDGKGGIAFAPVIVEAARPYGNAPIAAARAGRSSAIEIVIGVATVRIAPGTDAATLQTVLRAVMAAS
jgi:transposase